MADRYPLIYNPSANQIQELQSGDSLDLGNAALKNVSNFSVSGILTAVGFTTAGGTSSQFLKADGSVDSTTYVTQNTYSETSTLQDVLLRGNSSTQIMTVGEINATSASITNQVSAGSISAATATFTGNISVGGTITYEDVTNVDSVGLVTARTGLKVLAGGAEIVGATTATSFVKSGGTASEFLKADGSVDSSTYITAIGISSAGTSIGNATTLNFIGAGNTFAVNGNTIDVSIQGSAGGGGGALDITSCLFI